MFLARRAKCFYHTTFHRPHFLRFSSGVQLSPYVIQQFYYSLKEKEIVSPRPSAYKTQEELQNMTNRQVIKRELKNDSIQIPIKAIAYLMAPINLQPTFYAELIRTGVDTLNHIVLYGMNYVKMGPNEKYPYGIEKLKNIVVLLPSILFVFLGSEILVESLSRFFEHSEEVSSNFSLTSAMLYLVSIGIEMNVIKNNIQDALKLEEDQSKKSLLLTIKQLMNKKDPLLQAILYENAITFISTSVPMLCSIFTYFYPMMIIEVLGSTIISSISIYLGVHLFKVNVLQLMGEQQIEEKSLAKILEIMQSNPLVKEISEVKAVKYGSEKFRLSAKISFNVEALNKKVMSSSETNIQKILTLNSIYSQMRRENIFKNTINLVLRQMMKEIQIQIDAIEQSVQQEFQQCEHIDLEFSHQETEQDYFKIISQSSGQATLNHPEDAEFIEWRMWVKQTASQYLQKSNQQQHSLSKQLQRQLSSPDKIEKHSLSEIDNIEILNHQNNNIDEDELEELDFKEDNWKPALFEFFLNEDSTPPTSHK